MKQKLEEALELANKRYEGIIFNYDISLQPLLPSVAQEGMEATLRGVGERVDLLRETFQAAEPDG